MKKRFFIPPIVLVAVLSFYAFYSQSSLAVIHTPKAENVPENLKDVARTSLFEKLDVELTKRIPKTNTEPGQVEFTFKPKPEPEIHKFEEKAKETKAKENSETKIEKNSPKIKLNANTKPKRPKMELSKEAKAALKKAEKENKKAFKRKMKKAKAITNGKGTWVNIWNYPKDVESFVKKQKKYNIDTIYLQVNRSTTPVFKHKDKIDEILKIAHKHDMKVIGWSYCYLRNVESDAKKYIKPAKYVSKEGHSFDGMAADIEENLALWAVTKYTDLIKSALPPDYPMLAIVFAPEIKSQYPWEYIANNWDVMMPMAYWHGYKRRGKHINVFDFIKKNIERLKALTKKEDLLIHLITDGDNTTAEEVHESLKAAKEFDINAGFSIYPEHLAQEAMLEVIKDFDL